MPAPTRSRSAVGPGSICTTRVVAGAGVPQITAIYDCARAAAAARYPGDRRRRHPVLRRHRQGDRGRRRRGHARVAAGRRRREPRRGRPLPGRAVQGIPRHGLDRRDAGARLSHDRYFQERRRATSRSWSRKGSRGGFPTRARSANLVYQLVGGLRQAMGYCGAATSTSCKSAQFVRITAAGLRESHPHDVTITKEAPNYRR